MEMVCVRVRPLISRSTSPVGVKPPCQWMTGQADHERKSILIRFEDRCRRAVDGHHLEDFRDARRTTCGQVKSFQEFASLPVAVAAADLAIGLKVSLTDGTTPLDMPTHTFELLNESSDFLEHALLLGQILRIQRAHLGQNGIELRTAVTGKFPLQ